MKTSWRTLQTFAAHADAYLAGHKGETKISYAIKRVRDQITRHSEQLQARLTDIEIDLCVVDDREVIQRDAAGNLQFTRDGMKDRNRRQRELLDLEFEIEPFFVSAFPEDLTPAQIEAFSGLIIADVVGSQPARPPDPAGVNGEVPAMFAGAAMEAGE